MNEMLISKRWAKHSLELLHEQMATASLVTRDFSKAVNATAQVNTSKVHQKWARQPYLSTWIPKHRATYVVTYTGVYPCMKVEMAPEEKGTRVTVDLVAGVSYLDSDLKVVPIA